MATLSIRLLGGLFVEIDGADRTADFSGRLRALLAMLLLQPGQPYARASVAYALWPESTDKQARTNLRKLVLLLRAALGPCAHHLVVTDHTLTWSNPAHPDPNRDHQREADACWLDTTAFTQLLQSADTLTSHAAIAPLGQAVEYYRGDLLPDCYDEWILAAREQLRDRYINSLDRLCELLESAGRYAEGVAMARRLLQHDPIYERGHWHLVRLQALMQDRAGALQSYHRCVTLLRRELGVDPSPALEQLYLALLDHHLPTPTSALPQPSATIPLIGRQTAWQLLLQRWQQAQAGRAHFCLIVGEAGIGKSRLAEEILLWVERQGNLAAQARAYSSDNRTLSYAPVAGLLRAPPVRREVTRLPVYWLTEIARLLPELLVERADIPPPHPMLNDVQRHHLLAALTQALRPTHSPRLLVIDDLQWSDSETLVWLPHLLETAKAERLLVVGTVRSEEFEDYGALQAMCETLRRRGQLDELVLGPLDQVEIGELACAVVGQPLNAPQAQWLVAATEGNPLFVIETARLLHDDNFTLPPVDGASSSHGAKRVAMMLQAALPKSVWAVIEARLARLSPAARALAEVAATIGRSFTLTVLAAAVTLEEAQLVDALDELWRRRIIRERGNDAYDFSHDRIRDGAYAGISALRRRLLHKRVATALVTTHAATLDEVSGQLGGHYEEANERLLAMEWYLRAANVAAAKYSNAEALHYLDRVLALAHPHERATRFAALHRRDFVLEVMGVIPVWDENVEQLRQIALHEEEDVRVTWWRRAIVAERASRSMPRQHVAERAIALAREGVDYALLTEDAGLQAMCHLTYGLRLWYVADFDGAVPQLEQAITLARQVGDAETLAHALELRAQTWMFQGGSAATIQALMEESLANYEKVGHLVGRSQILNKIGYLPVAQGTGRYEEARAAYLQAIEVAQQIGAQNVEVSPHRNLGVLYTCMGDYAAANASLTRAQALHDAIGDNGNDPTILNYRGFLYLNMGRLADALTTQLCALEGLTAHRHQQWCVKALTALGWIHYRLGENGTAMRYATHSLAQCREINEGRQAAYTLILRGILQTEQGELAAARADFAEARTILHAFEMVNRALEAEVGLAYLDFLVGDHATARVGAHAILAHLEAHPVDFTEDVCQVLLTCQRILRGLDPAALLRLDKLIDHHVATRTATLDAATRHLFWQIPAHQELRQGVAA